MGVPYKILFWHKTKRGEIKMNLQRYFWGFQNGGKFRRYSGKGEQSYRILLYQKCYLICKRGRNYCKIIFSESKKGGVSKFHEVIWGIKNERRTFDSINSWGKIDTDYSFREILIEVKGGRGAFHPKFVKNEGRVSYRICDNNQGGNLERVHLLGRD